MRAFCPNKTMSALKILQKSFPHVKSVVDAKKSIAVTVTANDSSSARKKDPQGCALVRACVRTKIADAAVVGLAYTYLIKGNKARRYKTSDSIAREIVSFDRHHDFAAGTGYVLSKVPPHSRLGVKKPTGPKKKVNPKHRPMARHHTADVRVIRKLDKAA